MSNDADHERFPRCDWCHKRGRRLLRGRSYKDTIKLMKAIMKTHTTDSSLEMMDHIYYLGMISALKWTINKSELDEKHKPKPKGI